MALSQAIMTALIDDDMSGIDLAKSFEASLGLFWRASHQQIYQELHKLADRGWLNHREVNQSGKPNKIVYGLTAAGREALAEWVVGSTRTQAAKDELLVKLYNLDASNASHLAGEIHERRASMMRLASGRCDFWARISSMLSSRSGSSSSRPVNRTTFFRVRTPYCS